MANIPDPNETPAVGVGGGTTSSQGGLDVLKNTLTNKVWEHLAKVMILQQKVAALVQRIDALEAKGITDGKEVDDLRAQVVELTNKLTRATDMVDSTVIVCITDQMTTIFWFIRPVYCESI